MLTQGGLGGIFATVSYTSTTIAFVEGGGSADTITDSANAFLDQGILPGMVLTISGSLGGTNDKSVTVASVTEGTITLSASDDIADEAAGETITLATAEQGTQILGFSNQSLNDGVQRNDTTKYEDYPFETFALTIKNGTATLNRFWVTTDPSDWVGRTLNLNLFIRYSASPSATDPALYWSGDGVILGVDTSQPVGEMVSKSITINFNGAYTDNTKTTAWS